LEDLAPSEPDPFVVGETSTSVGIAGGAVDFTTGAGTLCAIGAI
jgi:hypothetical protein